MKTLCIVQQNAHHLHVLYYDAVALMAGTKGRCGSWPGLIPSTAVSWPHAAMTGKSSCGKSRTPAGIKSMNIQTMTRRVNTSTVAFCSQSLLVMKSMRSFPVIL